MSESLYQVRHYTHGLTCNKVHVHTWWLRNFLNLSGIYDVFNPPQCTLLTVNASITMIPLSALNASITTISRIEFENKTLTRDNEKLAGKKAVNIFALQFYLCVSNSFIISSLVLSSLLLLGIIDRRLVQLCIIK